MQIWSEDTVNQWRSHYDEAATSWGKWADKLAEQQVKVNQGLLMAAGVKPGAKLLDLPRARANLPSRRLDWLGLKGR